MQKEALMQLQNIFMIMFKILDDLYCNYNQKEDYKFFFKEVIHYGFK